MNVFKLVGKLVVETKDAVKSIEKTTDTAKKSESGVATAFKKIGEAVQKGLKKDKVTEFSGALEKLTQKASDQKSKLEDLKNKYKDLYLTHGKNSDGARAVAKEIEELSSELKKNKGKLEEADKAADKFDKSLEEVGDESSRTESKMSGAFKKIGAAVVAAFSIAAIGAVVSFGQKCVETAASVKAANAQFEQTFGTLQDTASAAMERVAGQSGILQTRLQGIGTQIYSFAMASGAESSEAMSLMETSLQATADAAAYYDRSLEETAESLQSFLKGNFENDAALGVSCTETTRNAAAMELFGQKYNDLTEIQKQQTLLKMVTDAQAASGAMGQAAREADGWENVLGNLGEAWKQIQAKLGEATMTAIVPALQKATDILLTLGDNAGTVGDIVGTGVNNLIDIIESILPIVSELGTMFMNDILPMLSQLGASIFPPLANLIQQIAPILVQIISKILPVAIQLLNMLLPAALQIISEVLPIALELLQPILNLLQPILDFLQPLSNVIVALAGPLATLLVGQLQPLIEIATYLLQTILPPISETLIWLADVITNYLSPAILSGIESNKGFISDFVAEIKILIEGIATFLSGTLNVIMGIANVFIAIFNGDWQAAGDALLQIATGISDMLIGLLMAAFFNIIAMVTNNIDSIKEFVTNFGMSVSNFFSNLWNSSIASAQAKLTFLKDTISTTLEAASVIVSNIVERMKGFFNFEFNIPKVKVPHFSVTPSGWKVADLLEGTIPTLGVEWYAKAMRNPMILNKPTAFGYDSVSGNILAGGESGSEVVSGTNTLMSMIRSAVESQSNSEFITIIDLLGTIIQLIQAMGGDVVIPVYLGTELLDERIIRANEIHNLRTGGH